VGPGVSSDEFGGETGPTSSLTRILVARDEWEKGPKGQHNSSATATPPLTYSIPILGIYFSGENQPHVKPLGSLRSYPFTSEIQPNGRPREPALEGDGEMSNRHEFGELYMDVLREALRVRLRGHVSMRNS
jgi:hypothetical protein